MSIELVGFDGDDTLWHSETYFQAAHREFEAILGRYVDLADARVHEHLLATEQRNVRLFGYGAKGMTLSMIETAVELTGQRIAAGDIHRIVGLGREILLHPVELLPDVRSAVEVAAQHHRIVLITKGDLFHQERKVAQSGLSDLFHRIEIVSEKDPGAYARVLDECAVEPAGFVMVGNSMRSDIEPVITLGGYGIHVPYAVTWAHEAQHQVAEDHPRVVYAQRTADIPASLGLVARRAAGLD